MDKAIAVLGANGRTGKLCVQALLAAGYSVRAGVHRKRMTTNNPMLTQHTCDVTKAEDVRALIGEAMIVVSLLGHGRKSPAHMQSNAMQGCIEALADKPGSRIITLTGTGVRAPGDQPNLMDKILNITINLVDSARISDGVEHVKVLQQGSVDWTILRVLKLTNQNSNRQPKLTKCGPAELFTPRARVAAAIVEIIENDSWHRALPVFSGTRESV